MQTPLPARGPQLHRKGPERRAWPRRAQKVRVLFLPDDCALEEPYAAWIVDCSRGGVRLVIERLAIDTGTLLRLRSPSAAGDVPWVTVRVKHQRQNENTWEVGCEFVRFSVEAVGLVG